MFRLCIKPVPGRRLAQLLLLPALLSLGACEKPPQLSRRPPVAEFLLAAGDSTYWVRSGPDGVRVRSAPILLTRTDGRFYEVFVTDDVHDYEDASFASARAFRRNITRKDSLLIFEDGTVPREVRSWQLAHPGAIPLDPSDIESDDEPPTLVTDDIEVVDVHGPWLTFAHSLNVDVAGRASHLHRRRRGVLDIRNGARASLAMLFGATEATRVKGAAAYAFAALRDSIRNSKDSRGSMARRTLASFAFDSMSFGLTDIGLDPAVSFEVSGTGDDGEALSLFLPAQKVAPPDWWPAVAATLPRWNADSSTMLWSRAGYEVTARPAVNGDVVFVSLNDRPATGAPRSWPIAAVPSPAYQLIPLDAPPLDSALRVALARAFDQSTALDGLIKQASNTRTRVPALTPASAASRTTKYPACPTSRLRQSRMSMPLFASRTSAVTSSACSRSRSASRFRER